MGWVKRQSKKQALVKLYSAKLLKNFHHTEVDLPKGTILEVVKQCKTADGIYCRVLYPGIEAKLWIPFRDMKGL